jgi:hypothetical protein
MTTLGAPCQKGIHPKCPQKLGSGQFCECFCHQSEKKANHTQDFFARADEAPKRFRLSSEKKG